MLDSSNSAQVTLALTNPPDDTWYEQLRSVMEAHAQDFAQWDVWAEEEDDNVVNEAQAAQVCQHFYKRKTQVDSSLVGVYV